MKIIFNADDYGLTRGTVYGILDAYKKGVVRSTTLMATGEAFDLAVEIAKENPGLDIGVHLVMTSGKALTKGLQFITDNEDNFLPQEKFRAEFDLEKWGAEIEREYTAQIEKVLATGIPVTHLDVHHNIEEFVHPIENKLAEKYDLAIRSHESNTTAKVKEPGTFSNRFYGEHATLEILQEVINEHRDTDKVVEFMCHPAYFDNRLKNITSYNMERVEELELLTNPRIMEFLNQGEIELVNFREL